jgi:predicted aspartyl protease
MKRRAQLRSEQGRATWPVSAGTPFASRFIVRRILSLAVGILLGQWLAWGASPSPSEFHARGLAAWELRDYAGALRSWSEGATLRPDDPLLHYRRATALARLGQWESASDAFRLVLLLDPPASLAQAARDGLASIPPAPAGQGTDTTVALEAVRGVWVARVVLNGSRTARFLIDTGSSVTIVAPPLATSLGLAASAGPGIELHTVAGLTAGPAARLLSLRLGDAEMRDLPVVVHDPGPDMDGILGNSFLGRYQLTLDAHRRLLHLHPPFGH